MNQATKVVLQTLFYCMHVWLHCFLYTLFLYFSMQCEYCMMSICMHVSIDALLCGVIVVVV